jgi:hypothetical protein
LDNSLLPITMDKITVIRSKRRTISLIVTPEAKLVVRAPLRTSQAYIENLVKDKSLWIDRKIAEVQSRQKPMEKEFVNGEGFLFMGKTYPLQIVETPVRDIELADRLYVPRKEVPELRELLTRWYIGQAKKVLHDRCEWFAAITGHKPAAIRISHAARRFGSCSTRGTICLSWRLIFAPPDIIDYVIVHELAHLDHHDHSSKFWGRVRAMMPDYEKRREWLKINDHLLTL